MVIESHYVMRVKLLEILRCPKTGQKLFLQDAVESDGYIETGILVSENGKFKYPISNGIPRFVPQSNYAENFGLQWNKFARTQLDSYTGLSISADRFYASSGWQDEDMKNLWTLEVGAGAGRFAEIALAKQCELVVLDYSNSVDTILENLKQHENLHILQANLYEMPFKPKAFDYVYSLGVIQHTPDVKRSFTALVSALKNEGKFCVDCYERSFMSFFLPKYWLRPITKLISQVKLLNFLQQAVPPLLLISRFLGLVPIIGKYLKRCIPVANHYGTLPLTKELHEEWSVLDTFDWLSPAYDNPQTSKTIQEWFEQAGFENIEVFKAGHLCGRGIKSGYEDT